jgi:hypothetical protein
MAKYQLLVDHFVGEALVPAGTEIDTDEPRFANFRPSMHTAGVDPEGKRRVNEQAERRRIDPVHALPTGFALNGDVRPEDVGAPPPPFTYTNTTPGQYAVPTGDSGVVQRVGEMEVAAQHDDAREAARIKQMEKDRAEAEHREVARRQTEPEPVKTPAPAKK